MSTKDPNYHKLEPELERMVDEHHKQVRDRIQKMQEVLAPHQLDLKPIYALDDLLKTQPKLLDDFKKDPEKFAKQHVGFQLPDGCTLHFIDPQGMHPPKADHPEDVPVNKTTEKRPWASAWTEIRIGIQDATGTGTIVIGMASAIPHLPPG